MSQSLRPHHFYPAATIDQALLRALRAAAALQGRSPWWGAQLRRLVLVLWWTFTGQIHTHARYWLRARRLRRGGAIERVEAPADIVDARTLVVPHVDEPLVSVIVPTYGQVPYTLRCLDAVIRHWPAAPVEVIVVDDAWPDRPPDEAGSLDLVSGIRLARNPVNLGYLRSCNKAAGMARGRYLYFLNNDTQVLDGWLDPMLALLSERNDAGAVGAKLLYPDGRLQEAGGIIWRDGTGWNFGRNDDASKPVYNYVREVDYCSAAALMLERLVFLGLGGFDERYAPAYFEDSDLCFRLRRIGLKTLYQPAARVVHHEGVSHGRDVAVGLNSYQVANQHRFNEVWGRVLASQHFPNGQNVLRARDRAMHRKVILVVDHFVPTPDRDAGSRTMAAFLRVLVRAGHVVKFWPRNLSYSHGYTEALQHLGIEVLYGPAQAPFAAWVRENGRELDTVLLSRPDVAEELLPLVRQHSKARVVYYGHDLHFLRMRRQAELLDDERLSRASDAMETRERAIWRQADLSLYPSDEEADIAFALQPDSGFQSVVPYVCDRFAAPRAPVAGRDIVFVGGFGHPPNEDAAVWFCQSVLPLIRNQVRDARLSIIGSNPTDRVRALAGEAVLVRANVSDTELAASYASARVAVVPLRCGGGVKLKVVEALWEGVPLVTTPVGAQGLPGIWQVVAVEHDPVAFAAAVVRLLTDDAAWERSCAAQLRFAGDRFTMDRMAAGLLTALGLAAADRQDKAA